MIALELNPCSGGMAEGFRRAGITFSWAFDWDPDACASYESNLGHRPIQMDIRDLLRLVAGGWRPAERLDLLVADPPCTPWSRAGKREGLDDDRDMLRDTVALIGLLQPRCWLIGNVPGLDDGPNLGAVHGTIGRLAACSYMIDYVRLDAADFGIPQHRVRPFWFGRPRGSEPIRWPAPTHGDPAKIGHADLGDTRAPWVTCRQALEHLSLADLGAPISVRTRADGGYPPSELDEPARTVLAVPRRHENHKPSDPDAPARTLTRNTHSDGALLAHPKHPINTPDAPSYAVTTKGDGRGAQGACVLEWPWERPSTTVHGDYRLAPPGHHGKSFLSDNRGHGPNAIKLSERAAMILQGFPDGWHIAGKTKRARWSQIGQAMPPGLAEAVARSIARWFTSAAELRPPEARPDPVL